MMLDIDIERKRISLSRKALLPDPWDQFARDYVAGDLIEGEVTSITDFGAFVRFSADIEGLVHISEMPLVYGGTPDALIETRERVLSRIISIQPEKKRVGLSMRRVSATEEIEWLAKSRRETEDLSV